MEDLSNFKTEKLKVQLHKYAKNIGLSLEIEGPIARTDFLDITLDLERNTYSPYRKKNAITQYIDIGSNHPQNILQQIPRMIRKDIKPIEKPGRI